MRYITKRNRAILREMVSSDFKVRYQGSVLGYMWSLLKPLFMFAILYVVFNFIIPLGKGVPHYPVYLFIGIVFWNFFNEASMTGLTSIVNSSDIIRKISIPRYLVVVASSVSALINLFLNLLVVLVFAVINGVDPSLSWLILPVLIIELFVLAQAVAFFMSAMYVKFRDINYIWELILQAGFYATPIIYPLTKIPEGLQKFFLLNPMAQMMQDARHLLISDELITLWGMVSLLWALIPVLLVLAIAVFAGIYFKRHSNTFAEDI